MFFAQAQYLIRWVPSHPNVQSCPTVIEVIAVEVNREVLRFYVGDRATGKAQSKIERKFITQEYE